MSYLLQCAGYSAYQAQCLAPWLWFIAIAAVLYVVVNATPESDHKHKHK